MKNDLQERFGAYLKTHCGKAPTIERVMIPLAQSPTGLVAAVHIKCTVCNKIQEHAFVNTINYGQVNQWNKEADKYHLWKVGDKVTFDTSSTRGYAHLQDFYIHSVRESDVDKWYKHLPKEEREKHRNTWYRLSSPKNDGTQRKRCDSENEYTEADMIQKFLPITGW